MFGSVLEEKLGFDIVVAVLWLFLILILKVIIPKAVGGRVEGHLGRRVKGMSSSFLFFSFFPSKFK